MIKNANKKSYDAYDDNSEKLIVKLHQRVAPSLVQAKWHTTRCNQLVLQLKQQHDCIQTLTTIFSISKRMDARKTENSVIEEERKEARGWINQRLYSS